jgi:pimeloyl-ACP methyl ester carboxylesterase
MQGTEACVVAADPKEELLATVAAADKMKADPKIADYAGMLDYLATDIRQYLDQPLNEALITNASHQAVELAAWMHKIRGNPQVLTTLRGQQEWAYLSKVDGTGQPFTIVIPKDYTPEKPHRLEVNLHGASGSHQVADAGGPELRLHVLGRNPYGRYVAHSEVDVLEAIDYVRSHWNVDPDRIHLEGDSMGGGGTFKLASRFPDLFASARPRCGYGTELPVENMVNLPVYSIHGPDDPLVPVVASRAAIRRIQESGGVAIQSETAGYGHMINGWADGVATASLWALGHKRVSKPARVHYTASDELARRAYWVEVAEWGTEGRPASVDATLQDPRTLYLNLDNVGTAAFDLGDAPVDLNSSITVAINRRFVEVIEPPLPPKLWVVRDGDSWRVSSRPPAEPPTRLHFPGGSMALYHGEPLMVVWGTQGTSEVTASIREAADSARKSTSPDWTKVLPHRKLEGIFNMTFQLVFGSLLGKPDSEVTEADMEKYNLLLIGTAAQNSVVARLAPKLPVSIEGGMAKSDDGQGWPFKDRALGLLYHNPLAPRRLVYWVASDDPAFYRPYAELMNVGWGAAPADFLMMSSSGGTLVAARRFDSRWKWEAGYAESPRVPDKSCSVAGSAELEAGLLRARTGSDYALVNRDWESTAPAMAADETRLADLPANGYDQRACQMDLTGKELLGALDALEKAAKAREEKVARKEDAGDPIPRFLPAVDRAGIDPGRTYSVATNQWPALAFFRATMLAPESFRMLDLTMRDVCLRFNP